MPENATEAGVDLFNHSIDDVPRVLNSVFGQSYSVLTCMAGVPNTDQLNRSCVSEGSKNNNRLGGLVKMLLSEAMAQCGPLSWKQYSNNAPPSRLRRALEAACFGGCTANVWPEHVAVPCT
jgi:hypothetical protein